MPAPDAKDSERDLTLDEKRVMSAAREKCFILYEGKETPHRSCGIALAETFNVATPPYQSLRKGGITGCGECGAVMAGRLILGELLGDSDPTGGVTPTLRSAMDSYEGRWPQIVNRAKAPGTGIVCNTLTEQFTDFRSPERAAFCAELASQVAKACAEALIRHDHEPTVTCLADVPSFDPSNPKNVDLEPSL